MTSKPFKRVVLLKGLSKVVVALRLTPGGIEKRKLSVSALEIDSYLAYSM
jgi:hypothetical protein